MHHRAPPPSGTPTSSVVDLPPHGLKDTGVPRLRIYLRAGEGQADREARSLMQVAHVVRAIGAPRPASADWNASPGELEATCVLELVGGI
eukprot:2336553-Pyramimonas_sp.AAC.1